MADRLPVSLRQSRRPTAAGPTTLLALEHESSGAGKSESAEGQGAGRHNGRHRVGHELRCARTSSRPQKMENQPESRAKGQYLVCVRAGAQGNAFLASRYSILGKNGLRAQLIEK